MQRRKQRMKQKSSNSIDWETISFLYVYLAARVYMLMLSGCLRLVLSN